MENYNQTDTEQNIDNITQIDRYNDRDYDGEFIYRTIIFSLMVLVIFISILCCHREQISKCFEHYLTTNGTSSDTEYANRVWRQHMENETKKMEPPEKRRARIWENIERNAVFMVRFQYVHDFGTKCIVLQGYQTDPMTFFSIHRSFIRAVSI
jgi:hypothetical protein